jgi:Zn-dependent protease with chaperone function
LWLWLIGDLAVLIPAEVSNERHQIALYTGHGDITPQVTAGTPYTLLLLFTILSGLTYLIFAAGVIGTMFPRLRGRLVERRFGLAEDPAAAEHVGIAEDLGAAEHLGIAEDPGLAEMQDYVGQHDPSIQLRATARDDQMARIYPVGWRAARIAVFRPLFELWRRDREAAQAILLHEVAHRRHGDQLVVGLGSPLVWLMRIWVPAFAVLVLAPVVIYAALGGGLLTQAVAGQGALQLLQPIGLLILPVTALWLAELDADLATAQVLGAEPVCRALEAAGDTRVSRRARLAGLLSRPPRRLRRRYAASRPAGSVALLAAWPTALIAQLLVISAGAAVAYLLISQPPSDIGRDLLAGTRQFLLSNRILIIAAIILLLLWPVLARPWRRLWSARPGPDGRQPWRPYLAAAVVPVALLGVSLAPLPGSYARHDGTPATCSRLLAWRGGPGFGDKVQAETAIGSVLAARTRAEAQNGFDALLAATAAGLRHPPPGAARASYVRALSDFRTAGLDLRDNKVAAAMIITENAITADQQASGILNSQVARCRH